MEKKSYIHEPLALTTDNRTLAQLHDFHTRLDPQQEAFVIYDQEGRRSSHTFQDVKEQSLKIAAILVKIGIDKGQRVVLMAPNCIEFIWCYLALNRIGANAILIPVPGRSVEVAKSTIQHLKCQALLLYPTGDDSFDQPLIENATSTLGKDRVILIGQDVQAPSLEVKYRMNDLLKTKEKELDLDDVYQRQDDVHLDDPAFCIFSSGSTGHPKAIQYTNRATVMGILIFGMHYLGIKINIHSFDDHLRSFSDRPFSWGATLLMGISNAFVTGSTFVACPSTKSISNSGPEFFLRILQDEKCSIGMLMPYLMHDMITSPCIGNFDLTNIQFVITAGQVISPPLFIKMRAVLPNSTIINTYAMSEMFPIAVKVMKPTDSIDTLSYQGMEVCSPAEVQIVNDDKEIVAIGEKGEIWVRSPYSFREYLEREDPQEIVRIDSSGWIHTDDAGYIDHHGGLHVCGRMTEVINIATIKIYPSEIEMVLATHPDVKAVAVIGVSNERINEEICACVIAKPGSRLESSGAEFEEWISDQWKTDDIGIAREQKHLLVMEAFPLTKTGKTDRKALKTIALQKLGRYNDKNSAV